MHITSIYKEHYLGETYRTGVAYLRARREGDGRAPRRVGTYSLARQREFIAKAARAKGVIIIAEYIEYGDREGYRPAFTSAVTFMSETGVPDLFVAREEYLARRPSDFRLFMRLLIDSQITLNPATDRKRQH
ncbi:recombinase family protein [Microbacterium sp. RURRCA19A]|uniref:recombinase family protein n=1 Tax=Microbacterium sp. RURRCA19A TaxID=1907391 RepID=UPI000953A860|nr:recombinase family protein [Microbacterium sp. RURRCA19A]SIS10530.1 hypothetical protein SAMN05880568_2796 [Microbacterium sp. RURRCA19A]